MSVGGGGNLRWPVSTVDDRRGMRGRILVIAAAAAIGAGLMMLATRSRPDFEVWLRQDIRGRSPLVVAAMIALTSGPLVPFSRYLWKRREQPRFARPVAVALAGSAIVLAFLLWRLIWLLTDARRSISR